MISTMAYLMSTTYSKPCQISKMMRHIEKPGLVRTVYSNILRHIQRYSAIFSHVQALWGTLRDTEPYSDIFRSLCSPCMYNHVIFRTLAHSGPKASSKACQTYKMIRHIQSPGIVRKICSSIFKDAYSATLAGVQLGCRRKASPALF